MPQISLGLGSQSDTSRLHATDILIAHKGIYFVNLLRILLLSSASDGPWVVNLKCILSTISVSDRKNILHMFYLKSPALIIRNDGLHFCASVTVPPSPADGPMNMILTMP